MRRRGTRVHIGRRTRVHIGRRTRVHIGEQEQVISKALQQQGFQCVPIGSETVRDAMRNPTKEQVDFFYKK